ncbi:hypothetical protein [Paenibacillus curdlanolyticus]
MKMLVKMGLPEVVTGSAAEEEEDVKPIKTDNSIVPDKKRLISLLFINHYLLIT